MWRPSEGIRRRDFKRRVARGERVEDVPEKKIDRVRGGCRTLLSGRPARVAKGQRPDGARAGALEALDGGRGRTLGRRAGRVPQEI